MDALIGYLGLLAPTFFLVFARALGVFTQAPVLSNRNIPAPVRVGLCVMLSILVLTLLPQAAPTPTGTLGFAVAIGAEFVLGALFGYTQAGFLGIGRFDHPELGP